MGFVFHYTFTRRLRLGGSIQYSLDGHLVSRFVNHFYLSVSLLISMLVGLSIVVFVGQSVDFNVCVSIDFHSF